jgi:glycosyltransferase-like protein
VSRRSIGLYTYSTVPRGSVVHAAAVADALADAGWDVTLYALDKDGRGFFRPVRARLRLIPAGPAPATTAALVRQRADEIASFLRLAGANHALHHAEDCLTASGLLRARARGLPLTVLRTVHHVERFADRELAACQEASIRQAAGCFAVSEAVRRDVAATFGVGASVVGNGVDVRRFQGVDAARLAGWRARLGSGGPLVLAVGGVEERKNSTRLLQAFARLRERHAAARLWILGGATVLDHGAARAQFQAALAALPGMGEAVAELGVVPEADVPALYRLADVVALPSLHEGFGLAALEALAAGAPLVASNRPPLTEFLDRSCAELVDPLSVGSIAGGLARALAAGGRLRGEARRRAEQHTWSRVAARHAELYERTLDDAGDALRHSLA